jgi:hypothetical protein
MQWGFIVVVLLGATAVVAAEQPRGDRGAAVRQVGFGIEVAKHGLWREAA